MTNYNDGPPPRPEHAQPESVEPQPGHGNPQNREAEHSAPQYGQPQYWEPQHGQQPGEPQYGQTNPAEPQYGQPNYGVATQHGQPQYAAPAQYAEPQHGQPQYAQTYPPQQAPAPPNPGYQLPPHMMPGQMPGQPLPGQALPSQVPLLAQPLSGWRAMLRSASGGLITFGDNTSPKAVQELVGRVRQPIEGEFRVAVLSLKGGVGKTTVTVGLGSALASLRREKVIAIDANPDLGTLARRVPMQTASTVRTLLHDDNINWYSDVRRHTNQAASGLEVLASESDPAVSEAFTEDEYLRAIDILDDFYEIILTDCGTGLVHSAMTGVLKSANALVLVASPAIDGAQSAAATLDWLHAHGMAQLAAESVVVIASAKTKNAPVDVKMLTDYFQSRVRAVQVIPYDPHLAVGGEISLDQMDRRTRSAFLELVATVVDRFAVPQQQTAWPTPPGQWPHHQPAQFQQPVQPAPQYQQPGQPAPHYHQSPVPVQPQQPPAQQPPGAAPAYDQGWNELLQPPPPAPPND